MKRAGIYFSYYSKLLDGKGITLLGAQLQLIVFLHLVKRSDHLVAREYETSGMIVNNLANFWIWADLNHLTS